MKNNLAKYIESTWETLKSEGVSTMIKVEESKAPIYLRANDQTVAFLLTIDAQREIDIKSQQYSNVNISIEKLSSNTKGIVVTLTNHRFYEIFTMIAADIISKTMLLDIETEYLAMYCLKIHSWRNMFSRIPQQLLTAEEQLGLYGELEFIKTLISEGVSIYDAVNAWRGADAEEKDFQFHNIGVEIKSSQKSDKLVKISNIRQLDPLGYKQLYLYYYSFAKSNSGDNTLPAQIESLRVILEGSPFIEEFELKLLNVGYYDADKENYTASYTLVNEEAYCVNSEFPKIITNNVMAAIIDASYIVDLNACDDFIVTYNTLIDNIKKYNIWPSL